MCIKISTSLLRAYTTVSLQSTCSSIAYLSIKVLFLPRVYTLVGPIFNSVAYFIKKFDFLHVVNLQ